MKIRAISAWPSDSIMHGSHGFLRKHGPQTSTQTLAAARPWTQTWPLVAAWSQIASWLWVEAQATQIRMAVVVAWLPDTNKATGCALTPLFHVTFGGNMNPDCNETQGSNMVLSYTCRLGVTIALDSSAGCFDLHDVLPPTCTQVAYLTPGINTDPGCNQATDPDMTSSCSTGPWPCIAVCVT